jgi:hypothetical protein
MGIHDVDDDDDDDVYQHWSAQHIKNRMQL